MSKLLTILVSFIIGVVVTVLVGMNQLPGMMIKEVPSPLGFEETVAKVLANSKELGWKGSPKWNVNFQKNLKKVVGVDVGPNMVIKKCEPKAAADILIHDELKLLTVMMPCSIAVYTKSDGKTYMALMNMSILGSLFGDVVKEITDKLAPQMDQMVTIEAAK